MLPVFLQVCAYCSQSANSKGVMNPVSSEQYVLKVVNATRLFDFLFCARTAGTTFRRVCLAASMRRMPGATSAVFMLSLLSIRNTIFPTLPLSWPTAEHVSALKATVWKGGWDFSVAL